MHVLKGTTCMRRVSPALATGLALTSRLQAQRAQTFVAIRSFFVQHARQQNALSATHALLHRAVNRPATPDPIAVHAFTRANLRCGHLATFAGFMTASMAQVRPAYTPPARRLFHSSVLWSNEQRPPDEHKPPDENKPEKIQPEPNPPTPRFAGLFKRLAASLPDAAHRPSRDDFLSVATNVWQRFRIRFKWFTIKSFRPFNVDDWSAFFSWYLVGQTLWILVGTTTFFMVVISTINSLSLQSYVARAISDYLTKETGVTVMFETAVVPKWKDSSISFKNVYISRRARLQSGATELTPDDMNFTMFDLDVDSIDVTLSLWRWLDGKGIVTDAVVKGVRGVLDRTNVFDPNNPVDPADFRHIAQQGDFELESLQLEDVLITVHQPGHFRPFTASIFRADMRRFRKQWIFYDFLSAESVVGQFDNCLFSVHKPQSIGRSMESDLKENVPRMSRFRIDGVSVDHLQYMGGTNGPISWITAGKVDAVLDITFPRDPSEELDLKGIFSEIAANINIDTDRIPGQRILAKPPLRAPAPQQFVQLEEPSELEAVSAPADAQTSEDRRAVQQEDPQRVTIDIDLRFRDLKAAVPIFTRDLSYVNSAFIRPMVAFVNANKTLVPIHCTVVKDISDFDGSWTMWEAGLIDAIGTQTYDAIAYHVTHNLNRKMKTVSLWGLQVTAQAVVSALRSIFDPVTVHLRDLYLSEYNTAFDWAAQ
ncbi:mitochondrial distribution and morphology proteins-domain-containing protein [Auriculariales sp. MPI-PUGE-AT-0066]|nr:mitochondrial distribution and morphology proteins-domain-containing protein [Auriculariales sp. MPI-PUGE-AT-0066]